MGSHCANCLEGSHCADWLVRSHRGDCFVGLHFTDASHSAVLIENCAGRTYNLLEYETIHWLIDTLHEDLNIMYYELTIIGLV